MNYAAARLIKENEAAAYRIYISDSLRAITGAEKRYIDYITIDDRKEFEKPVESAEGIVNGILNRTGIKMRG